MSQYNPKRAVALKYDEEKNAAPVIVASGLGHMAERIVEAAVENNVPVYEDNSLSTVLSQLDLGVEIPEELYQAVVEIYLYFLRFAPERQGMPQLEKEKVKVEVKARKAEEVEQFRAVPDGFGNE